MQNSLGSLITKLKKRQEYIESLRDKVIQPTEKILVVGKYLHQDTEEMTEEESAKFEQDNQRVFDILRDITDKLEIK